MTTTSDYESRLRQFDEEYPRRPIAIGDRVRWWPAVTVLGTPAMDAEWIEGVVLGVAILSQQAARWHIRVTGRSSGAPWPHAVETKSEGWTWPGTLVRHARSKVQPEEAPAEKTMREVRDRMAQVQRERLDYLAAKIPKPPTIETPWMKLDGPPPDPLDVKYDGVTLRHLLTSDETHRHERNEPAYRLTPAQRAGVSAHWSAELRAKIAAAKKRDRNQVTMEHDE